MKLTAKVRLKPTDEQAEILLQTMQEANAACDRISAWAWENKTRVHGGFGQYKIHHGTYHDIKASTRLSAQAVVRCVSKVADSYKLDRKRIRQFRKHGSIGYDARILSWKTDKRIASVWTVEGRQKIPYVTGEHHANLLQYQQGESDLCYIKGKFYLHTTCEVPDTEPGRRAEQLSEDILGVDLGIKNIATDSDGETYEGAALNELRKSREKTRASLQSRGTRSARKALKRISGRERITTKIANHTIAKALVAKAKQESKAICLEELKGIRARTNKRLRRSQRGLHNRWSFHQPPGGPVRQYIAYKAEREGVQVLYVPPAYTSKTCSCCKHIGKRNGESFKCTNCGYSGHSDHNAAENIRSWGRSVNRPEKSVLNCTWPSVEHISISGLKLPTSSR